MLGAAKDVGDAGCVEGLGGAEPGPVPGTPAVPAAAFPAPGFAVPLLFCRRLLFAHASPAVPGGMLAVLCCCQQVLDLDIALLDKKIDQMMPELGFRPEDNERLVASYSGGWQMRMCLGKILLQVGATAPGRVGGGGGGGGRRWWWWWWWEQESGGLCTCLCWGTLCVWGGGGWATAGPMQ